MRTLASLLTLLAVPTAPLHAADDADAEVVGTTVQVRDSSAELVESKWREAHAAFDDLADADIFLSNFHSQLENTKHCSACHENVHGLAAWTPAGNRLRIRAVPAVDARRFVLTELLDDGTSVLIPRTIVRRSADDDALFQFTFDRNAEEVAETEAEQSPPEQPKYWIGVSTEELGELVRAQLKLDEGVGLAVIRVVDDSPAKEAGLELHDVIVRVDETPMSEFAKLSEAVQKAGDAGEALSIEIVRKGKRRTIEVTPGERPQPSEEKVVPLEYYGVRDLTILRDDDNVARLWTVGPGVVVNAAGGLPKGVTVRVEKTGGEAARIHVERDGKFWDVTEKTLDELPEDLRGPVGSFLPKRGATPMTSGWRLGLPLGARAEAARVRNAELRLLSLDRNLREQDLPRLLERMKRIEEELHELRKTVRGDEERAE